MTESTEQEGRDPVNENDNKIPPNYSPVNFFDIDVGLYPLYSEINRRYTVILHYGDCIYIPAFYFY